ncbi:hypothetical protein BT63DRAFT_226521 [Microthyrium microscopicum]|uniref:GED domain-containing protein n=1 Tax=Microthyrium microscopicum TaxID=703497 RepID=A0A6A6UEP4_9PEZI|nr:hypothetical protein BT63DRAFT_226521 [Microthyrium microscopicum]
MDAITRNFVHDLVKVQVDKAIGAFARENFTPVIANKQLLDQLTVKELTTIEKARYEQRARQLYQAEHPDWDTEFGLDDKQRKEIESEKFRVKIGADPYDREIEVMAKVKAYYSIAATRFVENVILMVEADLLGGLPALKDRIEEELGVKDPDNIANKSHWELMLAQDPTKVQERQKLVAQHKFLTNAMKELEALEEEHDRSGSVMPDMRRDVSV